MDNLAIIYDEKFLLHEPEFHHPENSKRLTSVLGLLHTLSFLDGVEISQPDMAAEEQILRVHSNDHLYFVRDSIFEGEKFLDAGDTYIVKGSWISALLAAGSGITAVDMAADKRAKNIFCLVRPPGHHAGTSFSMGFCLFNNIAIAAEYASEKYKLKRIAIIDWDVYHGNGTQEIFYDSNKVLYISLHQYPFFPGTGSEEERGEGKGFGYTLNFPLPARTAGKKYLEIMDVHILKELKNYNPDIIFVSAGFGAHKKDPLADMKLESSDFSSITLRLKDFAESRVIPIISILEGGYDPASLAESVYEHLKILKE